MKTGPDKSIGVAWSKGREGTKSYAIVLMDTDVSAVFLAGTDSQNVVQHGKTELRTSYGARGINDYAPYFASNPERKGVYAGYDGPCPPWDDERLHHYRLKVFALDIKSLGISGLATGPQVMDALAGHMLAQGEVIGKYTLNPDVNK